jgi:hypothetical protein
VFLQTPDDGKSPETQKFLVLYTIVTTLQKLLKVAVLNNFFVKMSRSLGHIDEKKWAMKKEIVGLVTKATNFHVHLYICIL